MKKAVLICLSLLMMFTIGFIAGGWEQEKKQVYDYQEWCSHRDTIVDTIPYYEPVPVDSLVLRYETVLVPLYADSLEVVTNSVENVLNPVENGIFATENVRKPVENVIIHTDSSGDYAQETRQNIRDSVSVRIPITQKHYVDSTYEAWVSGWQPSLDSIFVYRQTEVVTNVIQKPPRRWGIGVQGGYGMTPEGFQPYVGIGVHFRLF